MNIKWKRWIIISLHLKILSRERDLESLRARNEDLEAHIRDAKEKQKKLEKELEVTDR